MNAWLGTAAFTVRSRNGLSMRVYRDIGEADAREWDSILGSDDVLMSHRFVRVCQEARIENAEFWHLLVSGNDGLVCVATLHRMWVNLELLSDGLTRTLIQTVKDRWLRVLNIPVLFCGLPVSCGRPCLKIRGEADSGLVCAAVIEAMEEIATATSTPLICLKEFDKSASEQMDIVFSHGYFRALSLPSCSLSLRWDSLSAYLASMKAGYRRQVQSSLCARREAGLNIQRLDDFGPHVDTIFSLYQQTIHRARHRLETLNAEFFRLLAGSLGGQTKAILIVKEGRPLAAAVMVFTPNIATFLFAGMTEDRNQEWQIYQNLILEVIAEAIGSGAAQLDLGQTSYAMKSRMGAGEEPRYLYLRYLSSMGHFLLHRFSGCLFPKHDYPQRRVFAR